MFKYKLGPTVAMAVAMALIFGLSAGTAAADYQTWLEKMPVADSPADSYNYVVYRFSPGGRYFANGEKYESKEFISRDAAATQLAAWEADQKTEMGYIAYRNSSPGEDEIQKEIESRYRKSFGKEMRPREEAPSIKGVWKGTELGGDVTFYLFDGNVAYASDGIGTWKGTWTDRGNGRLDIVLSSPHRIVYSMTARDGEIQGTGFNPSKNKTWGVTLSREPAEQSEPAAAEAESQPASRPVSLVGTSWSGVHQSTGDSFTLYLGANGRATFRYGRRSVPLSWSESGGTFSIEDITGGRHTASINADAMTTSLNGYAHWSLTRQ